MTCRITRIRQLAALTVAGALSITPAARAGFTPPDWQSAKLRIDTAELTAARNIGATQVNMAMLMDASGLGVQPADLSDATFGAVNAAPLISQGASQTGITEVDIPQYFWPALEAGRITLWLLITDTADAKFAIDFISIKIVPTGGMPFEKIFGSHASCQNNGFGLGIADGANLPSPLPGALTPTGTGFDETISSKNIHAEFIIPSPGPALLAIPAVVCLSRRRSRP